MEDILELIEQFTVGKLSAADFAKRYSVLWRELADEQRHALNTSPEVKQAYERLWLKRDFHLINDAQFEQEAGKLFRGLCRVIPGSKADRIINHLMVEADAYVPDAAERTSYQLGEEELLAEAQKALDELSA
jgi:hypothetical protein